MREVNSAKVLKNFRSQPILKGFPNYFNIHQTGWNCSLILYILVWMKNLFKAKVFREGGGGREYRESFQDNKIKLISFFLLMWHREAFQISGGIRVNLSYKLHILLFFSKYSSKAGGHAPQTSDEVTCGSSRKTFN